MFKRCLICTDFSDGLDRLLRFVDSLAMGGVQQVVFLHDVPLWEEGEIPRVDQDKITEAKARLSKISENESISSGLEVKIEVTSGRPLDQIPKIVEIYQSDVIIVGTPIRSLLQEKIFGSTTMGLTRLTSKPLMILRPQLISTYTSEELHLRCQHLWRYLLLPYNGSNAARYLLAEIKNLALQSPENSLQKCMLVWLVAHGGRRDIPIDYKVEDAKEKLASAQAELEAVGLKVNSEVRIGDPVNELLDAALNFDISAIAIAKGYSSNLLEWTVSSLANDILRSSWFPVLFFSPKK